MALFERVHGVPASVTEIYWPAGVTSLNEHAMNAVYATVTECFDVRPGASFTARLSIWPGQLALLVALRELGVTTLHVTAVPTHPDHRASLERFIAEAHKIGFSSIAFDVPIDDPSVSIRDMREWTAVLLACRPSRIFLTRVRNERGVGTVRHEYDQSTWPRQVWCEMYANLVSTGYEYVAQDVFAVHADEFVKATHGYPHATLFRLLDLPIARVDRNRSGRHWSCWPHAISKR